MMNTTRHAVAIMMAGITFYFVDSYFVGFAAALTAPTWFSEIAELSQPLALLLLDLITIVPVTIAVSLLVGMVLGKLVHHHFFVTGLASVVLALTIATIFFPSEGDFLTTIRTVALPRHWYQIPTFLALWLTLPCAAQYFGKRSRAT